MQRGRAMSGKTSAISRSKALFVLNVVFAVLAVLGQVGQNVSLPLWTGAAQLNCSLNDSASSNASGNANNSTYQPIMDPFFVVSFASLSFVVIFGLTSLVIAIVQPFLSVKFITKDDLKFPQWQLILVGVFDALNGIFVVYASVPSRTAPFLQAILGNFLIPLTIFFRLILLRKRPTLLKLICAGVVLLGLVLSLVPVIAGMDDGSKSGKGEWLKQSTVARILWPLCFMFGFLPAAVMNVIEEKSLKDTRAINLFYFLFWTSLYQLTAVVAFFWVDIIPSYGFTHNVHEFGQNYWFGLQCFFGHAGCDYSPGLRGAVFIGMYILSYIGGGLLIRYAEGATYLAIVQSLVTPLGALFWSVFAQDDCGGFGWGPHADSLTYFSIGGIVLMVPSIFLYNLGSFKEIKQLLHKAIAAITSKRPYEVSTIQSSTERSPLLKDKDYYAVANTDEDLSD